MRYAKHLKLGWVVAAGLFVFSTLTALPALANIGITPAVIQLELNQPSVSGAFVVTNTSDRAIRYRARTTHFTITASGGIAPVEPDEYSLADWIRFNPKEFTLEPKKSKKIRYVVLKPKNRKLKHREYWGAISFEPLKGDVEILGSKGDSSVGIERITNVLMPIFAMMGDEDAKATVDQVAIQNNEQQQTALRVKLENPGEIALRLRGEAVITNAKGKVAAKVPMPRVFVLPQHTSFQTMPIPEGLPSGDYKVRLDLKQDRSSYRVKQSFSVSLK